MVVNLGSACTSMSSVILLLDFTASRFGFEFDSQARFEVVRFGCRVSKSGSSYTATTSVILLLGFTAGGCRVLGCRIRCLGSCLRLMIEV